MGEISDPAELALLRKALLALEAYRRERISRSKLMELARLVDVSPEAMERLIDESGIDLEQGETVDNK